MRMTNICIPRLARFALCSSPAWLKTLLGGADVAVMHKISQAEAFEMRKTQYRN